MLGKFPGRCIDATETKPREVFPTIPEVIFFVLPESRKELLFAATSLTDVDGLVTFIEQDVYPDLLSEIRTLIGRCPVTM